MPSIIQTAFLIEALANVPAIVLLLFRPAQTLQYFVPSSGPHPHFDSTTIFLARSLGAFIFALTPQLLLAYPNSRDKEGKRMLAYWTLGAGEGALIPLLLWEALRETNQSKVGAGDIGGFSRNFCLSGVASLLPVLTWRLYVFQFKPHWFGDTAEVLQKVKKSE